MGRWASATSSPLRLFHVSLPLADSRRHVATSGGPMKCVADDVRGHARSAFNTVEERTMNMPRGWRSATPESSQTQVRRDAEGYVVARGREDVG